VASCTEVVIESPAYGMPQGAVDLGGLRWLVLTRLVDRGHHVHEVNPCTSRSTPRVRARGQGRRPRPGGEAVSAADVTNNNTADAVVLAAMLARHLGQPVDGDLSLGRLDAFGKVRWSA
jgi:crossover junction endodeoxyribonuclease RuvC